MLRPFRRAVPGSIAGATEMEEEKGAGSSRNSRFSTHARVRLVCRYNNDLM